MLEYKYIYIFKLSLLNEIGREFEVLYPAPGDLRLDDKKECLHPLIKKNEIYQNTYCDVIFIRHWFLFSQQSDNVFLEKQ